MVNASNGRNGTSSVAAAAMLIAALSFASRLLGLLRDRLLAGTFGAGPELDAYYAAFRVPDFLLNLIGLGALSAAFLPIYLRNRRIGQERLRAYVAAVASVTTATLAVVAVVGVLAAPVLYRVLAPGFAAAQLAETVTLGRIMFASMALLGLSAVVGGVLQAEQRFLAFSLAPLCYNAGIIIGVVFLARAIGMRGVAYGVVLGAAAHLAVQWIAARRAGFVFRWNPSWRDPDMRATARLLLPRVLGLASSQVHLVVLTAIASLLAPGSLTVFTLANNIQMVPVALIGVAFAVAAFPALTDAADAGDRARFRAQLSGSLRQVLCFAFPAVVLLITLKAQLVRVVLGAGAFDWGDTIRTLTTLEAFGYGLIAAMAVPLLARACYAFADTRTPFLIGVVADIVAIVVAWVLGQRFGPRGLALAVALAGTLQAACLLVAVRFRAGALDGRRIVHALATFAVAGSAMALVIQSMKPLVAAWFGTDTFMGIALQGIVAGITGGIAYVGVGLILRSEEITALTRACHRHLLRAVRLPFGGAEEVQG